MGFRSRILYLCLTVFSPLLVCGLNGCSDEFSELCSGRYDGQFTEAIAGLAPLKDRVKDWNRIGFRRGLASVGDVKRDEGPLNQDSRDGWQTWAQSQLKRIESYLDYANLHREESPRGEKIRLGLSNAANELVAFHGDSQRGRVDRMIAELERVEKIRIEVQGLACGEK